MEIPELKNKTKSQKDNPYLSNTFKLWIVIIIFFLTFLQLYSTTTFPNANIIPGEFPLSIVLLLVGYLWVQEFRDRFRLESLNRALIEAQNQLERAEIGTITTLILTEEAKDAYVRGHSMRVAVVSLAIAKEMGFSEERQMVMERASILHDLGKLGILDNILNKPGSLNEEEWKIIKKHPQVTIDIIKPLKFLFREKEIIKHHHERYDGKGYPDGLKGEEIPLESRILAVADTFDAMNSERSYRKPLSPDAIIAEFKKVSGTQLDSSITALFLDLLKKNPALWKK